MVLQLFSQPLRGELKHTNCRRFRSYRPGDQLPVKNLRLLSFCNQSPVIRLLSIAHTATGHRLQPEVHLCLLYSVVIAVNTAYDFACRCARPAHGEIAASQQWFRYCHLALVLHPASDFP